MSSVGLVLNKDLCRCCHSKGKFKSLSDPCPRSKEAYSDMLRFCFEVNLTPIPGMHCISTYKICNLCIIKLQNAVEFKNSVLTCEDQFRDMYSKSLQVKEEHSDVIEIKEESSDEELIGICEKTAPVILVGTQAELEPEGMKTEDEDDGLSDFDLSGEGTDEDVKKEIEQYESKAAEQRKANMGKKQASTAKRKGTENKDGAAPQKKKKSKGECAKPKFRLSDEDYKIEGDLLACARCDQKYDKMLSLKVHVKNKHTSRYKCPYCDKEFKTPAPWMTHKLEEHNVDDRYKCNACKSSFNTPVQLRKHTNNFHMLGEKYSCQFCDYESFSFEGLYKHKVKHKTVKDHHCKFCKKAFLRKATKDLHERIHTGDRRKVCKICSQAFVQKASLNYHMAKYHPGVNF